MTTHFYCILNCKRWKTNGMNKKAQATFLVSIYFSCDITWVYLQLNKNTQAILTIILIPNTPSLSCVFFNIFYFKRLHFVVKNYCFLPYHLVIYRRLNIFFRVKFTPILTSLVVKEQRGSKWNGINDTREFLIACHMTSEKSVWFLEKRKRAKNEESTKMKRSVPYEYIFYSSSSVACSIVFLKTVLLHLCKLKCTTKIAW